ncbi:S-layer family protein, partial [Oscillatoriales cyanobacterium LEGE 11467]
PESGRKSIELFRWWVPALAIAFGSGIGENPAIAQLIPDDTLGGESSIVTPLDGLVDRIDGGAVRGGNLFHSFGEFNIDAGRGAFFDNPAAIENILTRVTGPNPSNIFGTLGVLGDANLFLVNPSGIVFGPDARLDVGGSFFASTAGGILFPDGYEFSTTNPDAPPLLTVNVPIGLQFGANPGEIVNQSQVTQTIDGEESIVGLQVPLGETLALVGGNIMLTGGRITALEGRVELGSAGSNSFVSLTQIPTGTTLGYEGIENFQDIGLTQEAAIVTNGNGGGNIQIQGRNFLQSGSEIQATNLGSQPGGTVAIRTSESVELLDDTTESNALSVILTSAFGEGSAGNIVIETGRFAVRNGSAIGAVTFGRGTGGNFSIRARDVELSGTSANGDLSRIISETQGLGDAGNIDIDADHFVVRDGGVVSVATERDGSGGNLQIRAQNLEVFGAGIDEDGDETFSTLFASTTGAGNAGNVTIDTDRLAVLDGGTVTVLTGGDGQGGTLQVRARDIELSGIEAEAGNESSQSQANGLLAGTQGLTRTFATGDAGEVIIDTEGLTVRDGAQISATTSFSEGDAGDITIRSQDIDLIGTNNESGILAGTIQVGGDAGSVTIDTDRLKIQDDAFIFVASILSRGNAGTITVRASESVEISRTSPESVELSGLLAGSFVGAGNAGNITLETARLSIRDGGAVFVGTLFSEGDAGTITIRATDSVELVGTSADQNPSDLTTLPGMSADRNQSSLVAATILAGNAGNVNVETDLLTIRDDAKHNVSGLSPELTAAEFEQLESAIPAFETELSSDALGLDLVALSRQSGNPGSINIRASRIRLDERGTLNASSNTGQGGNINLRSGSVQLLGESLISAAGSETGITFEGNIDISADTLALVEMSQILTNAFDPQGGSNITIRPRNRSDSGIAIFQSDDSLINAEGDLTIEGDIEFDPAEVPDIETTDVTSLISQGCEDYEGSEFYITGRGGLPPDPRDILPGSSIVEIDWVEFPDETASEVESSPTGDRTPTQTEHPHLVEAQGWIADEAGNIILTAQPYRGTPHPSALQHLECQDGDRFGEREEARGESMDN